MAKRQYFLQSDFDIFFNDVNWIKNLKKKVDYTTVHMIKDGRGSFDKPRDSTFLACAMSYIPFNTIDAKETIDYIFKNMDLINYQYSEKDLMVSRLGASVDELWTENLIYLFEKLESKGINFKTNSNKVMNSWGGIHHPKLDKYFLENNIAKGANISRILDHYSQVIDQHYRCIELGVYKMLDKKSKNESIQKYEDAKLFIKEIIDTKYVSKSHLTKILKDMSPQESLLNEYIKKNNLTVNWLQTNRYFSYLEFKPQEVFNKDNIELIKTLEKKLNTTYLDYSKKSPEEVFQETKIKKNIDFSGGIIIQNKNGTQIKIN